MKLSDFGAAEHSVDGKFTSGFGNASTMAPEVLTVSSFPANIRELLVARGVDMPEFYTTSVDLYGFGIL